MPLLEQVLEKYPKEARLVFKNFPLRSHAFARPAAAAALAAGRQGKFWEDHDALFANYQSISEEKMADIARTLGLDVTRFDEDRRSAEVLQAVDRDLQEGLRAGVRGTPTIFVNGRLLRNRSMAGFDELIGLALERAKTGP